MNRPPQRRKSKRPLRPRRSSRNSQEQNQNTQREPHLPSANSSGDLATALELQRKGQFGPARDLYCQILEREPHNPDAWHLLGMTFYSVDQPDAALECLNKANELVPDHPEVLANLGLVYRGMGDLKRAQTVLEQAVVSDPASLAARNNLGTVLLEQDQLNLAAAQFEAILERNPEFANAAMNLGNVWQRQGRLQDAETIYRQILIRDPASALLLNNLGETLRGQGKQTEAMPYFHRAIESTPNAIEPQINLGRGLMDTHQHDEAQKHFTKLVDRFPNSAKVYHYLGKAMLEVRDLDAAESWVQRALELDATDPYAQCTLGFVYLESGRSEAAGTCFAQALELDPTLSEAHSSRLFVLSGDPDLDQSQLFTAHQQWGNQHGNVQPLGTHLNVREPNRKLRIGYVSPDFRQHAVAAFLKPVLLHHDATQIETYCYSEVAVPDQMTHTLREQSDHWHSTKGLSDHQVAMQIQADGIDLLVDLAGHTAGNRLKSFAYRPAPIQITWLGYPNTTGLEAMDYRLTCAIQNPSEEPSYHTEQLVRMPFGSFCFEPPENLPTNGPLPKIKNGHVTFGSLHRPFKISPTVRELWADLLHAVPDSRLILFNTRFNAESITSLERDLLDRGITADRFEIRNQMVGDSYLETYREIDIGLDVTPWAGGTTTLEALAMGVPVIATYGDRRSARSTAAIVGQSGLGDLIAYSNKEYVQIACRLVSNVSRLNQLRLDLRQTIQQTVCNATRFTRELEQTYRTLWCRWLDNQ